MGAVEVVAAAGRCGRHGLTWDTVLSWLRGSRRVCEQRVDLAWRWAAEGKNDDDSSICQTVVDHMFPGVLLKCRL